MTTLKQKEQTNAITP